MSKHQVPDPLLCRVFRSDRDSVADVPPIFLTEVRSDQPSWCSAAPQDPWEGSLGFPARASAKRRSFRARGLSTAGPVTDTSVVLHIYASLAEQEQKLISGRCRAAAT